MVKPLAALAGVTKLHRLGGQVVQALSDVTLFILRGEFVAVTGPLGLENRHSFQYLAASIDHLVVNTYSMAQTSSRSLVSKLPSSGTNALDWCSKTSICYRN